MDVDPSDSRLMFWEKMRRLFFAMREIEPEDLDDETMENFLKAMDEVSNILQRIEKKRRVLGGKLKVDDLDGSITQRNKAFRVSHYPTLAK